jgi:hypothetical protein
MNQDNKIQIMSSDQKVLLLKIIGQYNWLCTSLKIKLSPDLISDIVEDLSELIQSLILNPNYIPPFEKSFKNMMMMWTDFAGTPSIAPAHQKFIQLFGLITISEWTWKFLLDQLAKINNKNQILKFEQLLPLTTFISENLPQINSHPSAQSISIALDFILEHANVYDQAIIKFLNIITSYANTYHLHQNIINFFESKKDEKDIFNFSRNQLLKTKLIQNCIQLDWNSPLLYFFQDPSTKQTYHSIIQQKHNKILSLLPFNNFVVGNVIIEFLSPI